MSKKVLVTGGSGFIGSHVVDFLIEEKYNVTIYDLFLPKRRDVKFIKGSILDNILGTTYLLEASKNKNIKRFIFAGSVYSYGIAGNLYTTSKIASELIIKNYKLLFNQEFTILRYTTAYGPRSREVDAISIFVERALKNMKDGTDLINNYKEMKGEKALTAITGVKRTAAELSFMLMSARSLLF